VVGRVIGLKLREIKEIEKHKCPVDMVYGNSRYWGAFFHPTKKLPATFIRMYIRGITPRVFDEILEHEMYHQALFPLRKTEKFNRHEEHWIIDKMLQTRGDWF